MSIFECGRAENYISINVKGEIFGGVRQPKKKIHWKKNPLDKKASSGCFFQWIFGHAFAERDLFVSGNIRDRNTNCIVRTAEAVKLAICIQQMIRG